MNTQKSYLRTNSRAGRANTITFKKSKKCQFFRWSSKKYGNRSRGARKYCQWATFLKVKFEEFKEKRLASLEKGFYEPIKRSAIQITIEKRKIQKRYLF